MAWTSTRLSEHIEMRTDLLKNESSVSGILGESPMNLDEIFRGHRSGVPTPGRRPRSGEDQRPQLHGADLPNLLAVTPQDEAHVCHLRQLPGSR